MTSNAEPSAAAVSPAVRARGTSLTRGELLTLLFVVAAGNALLPTIVGGIAESGIVFSVLNTFEISAIVWMALAIGSLYGLRAGGEIRRFDRVVAAVVLIGCLLPLGPATWVLVTLLAVYAIQTSRPASDWLHRAGWVFVAVTVPMFWSKRLFNFFSELILSIDAMLVSSITHTARISNLVAIPDGSGYLQIAATCSSMANVSLAVLCWIMFTQITGVRWRVSNVLWCALACALVVVINVTRISLIGFYPNHYDLIHGDIGGTIASWATIVVVLAVCYYGVANGRLHAL